jgi:2-iminoacetate synthase ThiH
MNAAEALAPSISEPMTWAEICERYPDQRVCLVEMDRIHSHGFEFRTARVVGHGKTRSEAFDQARRWRDHHREIGHYFTGKIKPAFPRYPRIVMTGGY